MLARAFGKAPGARANDGVVPLRSQLHGSLVWAGYADHLDVLGHFDGGKGDGRQGGGRGSGQPHVDWLHSGSNFDRDRFDAMTNAVAEGMRRAAREKA